MKALLTTICIFINLTTAFALENNDYYQGIARSHLIKHGYGTHIPKIEQETENTFFYLEEFAKEDPDFPCHAGVIVKKKSGVITLDVTGLDLSYPYSDIFIDQKTKIVWICAD
ncbi:MAG TPA: hypothetical protein VI754_08815 [Bacteriovoracaceae bacterium]|nr:hypothetical protein [Bacteriovoracaceae bacterium]